MHLHAALVPPATVRAALTDLVAAAERETTPEPAARKGFLGRRSRDEPAPPSAPQLTHIETERLAAPITDFGFLSSGDARRVVDALTDICAALPPGPTVRVSGGAALIDPDDRSVWADLAAPEDDLAALRTVASAVVSGVQPLGLFCDRRQYRARIPVATITESTTVEVLESVLAALASYSSEPWTVTEVAVVQRGAGVWRSIPIGPGG